VAWKRRSREALERLAREADVDGQPPQALFLLESALYTNGSAKTGVELLRRAQEAHPGDFWINQHLGKALIRCEPPEFDEASRFLPAAVALRPDSAGAQLNLGIALAGKGRRADAIVAYLRAVKLKPDYAQAHHNLGEVLQAEKQLPRA